MKKSPNEEAWNILGKKIDCYRIKQQIGEGGAGRVFYAETDDSTQKVAIKILKREGTDAERRFEREIKLAQRLRHKNIVSTLGFGSYYGHQYSIMEFVPGETLNKKIFSSAYDLTDRLVILTKVADALHYAHSQGIIHRDIKPRNIIITNEKEPKITDFGLAKEIPDKDKLTREPGLIGTPFYMAPEQFQHGLVDARTDVYSLGVVCYELLTGKLPFTGQIFSLLNQIIQKTPIAPSKINHKLHPDLNKICLKAMEKNSDARYENMHQFSDAILTYLNAGDISSMHDYTSNNPISESNRSFSVEPSAEQGSCTLDIPTISKDEEKRILFVNIKDKWKKYIQQGLAGAGLLTLLIVGANAVFSPSKSNHPVPDSFACEPNKKCSLEQLVCGLKTEYITPESEASFNLDSAAGTKKIRYADEFKKGIEYAKKDDFNSALLIFDRIAQYGLNNTRNNCDGMDFERAAILNMGIICLELQRYSEAISLLSKESMNSADLPELAEKRDYLLFVSHLLAGNDKRAFEIIDALWTRYNNPRYFALLKRHFADKIFADTAERQVKK